LFIDWVLVRLPACGTEFVPLLFVNILIPLP
jgi:hypothetical protein